MIVPLVAVVIAGFLLPFLRQKAGESRARAGEIEKKADRTEIENRKLLEEQVKAYAYDAAGGIVEREYPKIAARVVSGDLKSADDVKAMLHQFGSDLRAEIVSTFDDRGYDLAKALGEQSLDRIVEWAANKTSPFPGKDTAVEFLTGRASKWLVEKGVDWVRSTYAGDVTAAAKGEKA